MPEQDIAHGLMFGKRYFALFPDLGTGKTFMLLREFLAAWQAGLVDGALVIAPPDVHAQWIDEEWPKICKLPCIGAAWPALPPMERANLPRIFTIYPEAFRRRRRKGETPEEKKMLREHRKRMRERGKMDSQDVWKLCQRFMVSGRIALIIDESQMVANASSNTTRRIKSLKPLAAYRRIASGFPAPKKIQYYAQYSLLSTRILECQTKGEFMDRYCVMGGFKGKQIVGYQNEEDFNRRVAPYTYTVRIEDCVDMPERTYETYPVRLSPEQERLIRQINDEFRAVLGEDTINMPLALQRLTRIQQVSCGFLPKLDQRGKPTGELQWIKEHRTEALENLINSIRGKVIIWSRFKPCILRLAKHFGDMAVQYRGGMSKQEKLEAKNEFIRRERCKLIFAQSKSAGTGTNGLTVAHHMVYWSNEQVAQLRRQTERRIWRIGQEEPCVYVDLVAKGTHDANIRRTVRSQLDVATGVLKDIARWRI